jgi:hypothetical protein
LPHDAAAFLGGGGFVRNYRVEPKVYGWQFTPSPISNGRTGYTKTKNEENAN